MKLESRVSSTLLDMRGIFSSFSPFFASAGGMLLVFPFSVFPLGGNFQRSG